MTEDALRWGARKGSWRSAARGGWTTGPGEVTVAERSLAAAVLTGGVVSGAIAGELLGLDSVVAIDVDFTVPPGHSNQRDGARRRALPPERIVEIDGVLVASGLQTLLDLAAQLDDARWEQALESALRMQLTNIAEIEAALPEMSRARMPGVRRIRRVLALRPSGAPRPKACSRHWRSS